MADMGYTGSFSAYNMARSSMAPIKVWRIFGKEAGSPETSRKMD